MSSKCYTVVVDFIERIAFSQPAVEWSPLAVVARPLAASILHDLCSLEESPDLWSLEAQCLGSPSRCLRAAMGVVPQDTVLFNDTIR